MNVWWHSTHTRFLSRYSMASRLYSAAAGWTLSPATLASSPKLGGAPRPPDPHRRGLRVHSFGGRPCPPFLDPDRRGATTYSLSRRIFLRLRLRASACFARRLSPGFR